MSDLLNVLKSKQQKLGKPAPDVSIESSTLLLDQIADRASGDTRPLNSSHVEALAESIALLGLIEPLVVDCQGRLLAGSHRRAAISHLRGVQPDIYDKHFAVGVPVHRMNFDSELQPDLAIQVEVAENEQRRDYTPAEVRAIAERFKDAGYKGSVGRPGKGISPLIPALMAVIGKSRATVKRYLSEGTVKIGSDEPNYEQLLRQSYKSLSKWLQKPRKTKAEKAVEEDLARLLERIEGLFGQEKSPPG